VVHLVLGNTNDNDWSYIEKNVALNKPEKFILDFNKPEIKVDKDNKEFLISSIKFDLQQLGLTNAIKYLDNGDLIKIAGAVFVYRSKTKETMISQRVLNNLFILASIENPDKKIISYGLLNIYKDFLNRTMELKYKNKNMSQFVALSFKNLEKLVEDTNNGVKIKNYPNWLMVNTLSTGYGLEVLGN
jgi:hypothetical protein